VSGSVELGQEEVHDLALPGYEKYSLALRGLLAIGKQREFQDALRGTWVRMPHVNDLDVAGSSNSSRRLQVESSSIHEKLLCIQKAVVGCAAADKKDITNGFMYCTGTFFSLSIRERVAVYESV